MSKGVRVRKPSAEEVGEAVRELLGKEPGFTMNQLAVHLGLPLSGNFVMRPDMEVQRYTVVQSPYREHILNALESLPSKSHDNLLLELFHKKREFHASCGEGMKPLVSFFGNTAWKRLAEDLVSKNPSITRRELADSFGVPTNRLGNTVFTGSWGSKVLGDWWKSTNPTQNVTRPEKEPYQEHSRKMERIRNRKFPGL